MSASPVGSWQRARMTTAPDLYRGSRSPAGVIEHAAWLHHRFSLSPREVEAIPAARGGVASHEGICERGLRFGRLSTDAPKRRRPRPGDTWFLDAAFIRVRDEWHHLRRAVDRDGHVLDIPAQSRRDARAAGRFSREPPRRPRCAPRAVVTDQLEGHAAATHEVPPRAEHRRSRRVDDRVEAALPSTRRRERWMQRFESARHAWRFLSAHGRIHNHVQLRRHRLSATDHRNARGAAFRTWREVTGVAAAA